MKIPQRLYKYQAYSSYALEALVRRSIWISDPTKFNDPFDCKVNLEEITSNEQLKVLSDAADALFDKTMPFSQESHFRVSDTLPKEIFLDQLKLMASASLSKLLNVGVYSMTSCKDDLLMWAHYADHHRGFALCFDATDYKNNDAMQLFEITYSNEFPELGLQSVTNVEDLPRHLWTIASRKGEQWKNEAEWRLVFPQNELLKEMPMLLAEIIFGHRMDDSHKKTIYELVSTYYNNVEFWSAEPSKTNFRLELKPY